jgi:hypothetical protein
MCEMEARERLRRANGSAVRRGCKGATKGKAVGANAQRAKKRVLAAVTAMTRAPAGPRVEAPFVLAYCGNAAAYVTIGGATDSGVAAAAGVSTEAGTEDAGAGMCSREEAAADSVASGRMDARVVEVTKGAEA